MPSPHVIGIDDGPIDKRRDRQTLVVGAVMAGAALVEGILTTTLPIDGAGATEHLAAWINRSRFRPVLRAVFLDGITIAGLSVVDLPDLAARTGLPVVAVTRKEPDGTSLPDALRTAGLTERRALVERAGPAHRHGTVSFACAGTTPDAARTLLETQLGKSRMPECLRLAHVIAAGVVLGESRGG